MLKKELLDQAEALEIELNNKAIERYVEYGLIVGKRVSQGYSMGVVTQYHERTLEAIQQINELAPKMHLEEDGEENPNVIADVISSLTQSNMN